MDIRLNRLLATSLFMFTFISHASGLITNDSDLRNDLAWLSDRGVININLSTWPLSQEEIIAALAQAKTSGNNDQNVINRVKQRMDALKSNVVISGYTSTDKIGTPQGFGQNEYADHRLTVGAGASDTYWDAHVQGAVEGGQRVHDSSKFNLDGSYGAVNIWDQWLSFGIIPQWWGPGYDGSLIRSDAARPVTGFMLQRAEQTPFDTPWLSWLGRWQYQLSAGQLKQYSSVPHAKLIGARLALTPTDFFEFSASQEMQWGGSGRPETWHSFWNGLMRKDHASAPQYDYSNRLAGFDFKLKMLPLIGYPVSFYGQLIGEQQAGIWPSKNLYLVGLEGHPDWGSQTINWFLEGSDTRSSFSRQGVSYTHHTYTGGYYQQGAPLGHPIGGDGQMLSGRVELVTEDNQRWSTRLFYARVNPNNQLVNQAFPKSAAIKGIQAGWGYVFPQQIKLDTSLWCNDHPANSAHDVGAGLKVEWPMNL